MKLALPRRARGCILLYHRIAEPQLDPQLLCVSRERFAEHLDVISTVGMVVPLSRAAEESRGIVVTFDDGYADNLEARDRLAERDMTATVFVASGLLSQSPWWEEIERLVLRSARLPETLSLQIAEVTREWEAGDAPPALDRWSVLSTDDPSPRHTIYRELHALLRPLQPNVRDDAMLQLRGQIGPGDASGPTLLSPEGIVALMEEGVVDVGAHTVRHPVLASLALDQQRSEIVGSKAALESIVQRPITSFSYPFGSASDYSSKTVEVVRKAGFERACANVSGVVTRRSDRFQLPRFLVRDWPGAEFERYLSGWLRQ